MNRPRRSIVLMGDSLNVGGTEGQLVELACGLDKTMWDVHVSCVAAEGPLLARLDNCGVAAWSCGRGPFKSPRFLEAVWGLVRYFRTERIRLVHTFDFYSNTLGVVAARLAGVRTIIASQRDLGNLLPPLETKVQRKILRMATLAVTNSDAVAERVKTDSKIRPDRIRIISNGVDLSRFYPAPRAPQASDVRVIGTVANLRPEKGLSDLIQAAKIVGERYPACRFVIWGDGPERENLEASALKVGPRPAIEFRGRTDAPESALRDLDIFVLPSLSEATSNCVLEAMATGLPVVATRVGGTPRLVADGVTGWLVPPARPELLAGKILELLEVENQAMSMGNSGRQTVEARFSISRMVAEFSQLYQECWEERAE